MSEYPIDENSVRDDLTDRALARRTDDYKRDTNFGYLVKSFTDQLQEIENATWEVILERLLDNAEGVQLTVLGKIVGEPRFSADDDEYRVGVRCRIAVNKSQGFRSDIYLVCTMCLRYNNETIDFKIREHYPCTVFVDCADYQFDMSLELIMGYLHDTRSGGVRLQLIYPTRAITNSFTWAEGSTVETDDQCGFDDGNTPGSGGYWAGVI
jgi:hypothetical protein